MNISRTLSKLRNGRSIAIGVAVVLMLVALMMYVRAGNVTQATNTNVSADYAASVNTNPATAGWTTLTGPTYAETINGDLNNGTVVLTIPSGFELNTSAGISVVLTSGDSNNNQNMNLATVGGNVASTSSNTVTVTSSTVTFSIFSKSKGNVLNTIVWQGIQVRPTVGYPLATGNITASGTSGISIVASSTNFGTLTEVPGAAKKLLTLLPGQTFTAGTGITGTVANQVAGTAFNINTLIAVDQFNNVASSYTGTKTITYAGPASSCGTAPSYTTSVAFTSGQSTTALATTLKKAETTTITATDGLVPGTASSNLTVAAAPVSKLVVTLPGETFSACSGNSGTPTSQTAGTAFNITSITATDAYFNVISTYSGTKTLSYSGPGSGGTYTTSVNFSNGQSTTALATTLAVAETTTITVSDGAVSGPASSSFLVNPPPVGNFNAFETTTTTGATSGVIKTKISGTAFQVDLVALTSSPIPAISTSFTGAVKVELVDNSTGVACSAMPATQASVTETFTAADKGRHRIALITETNAWKNVKVRISYPVSSPTIVNCSSDNFAIRPSSLDVAVTDQLAGVTRTLNNTTVPGGTVHKAGQTFSIQATARSSTGAVTTGYSGTPTTSMSQCGTGTSVCPVAASLGTLSAGTWSSSSGVVTTSTATYSDVGAFALVLQDQQFAAVDVNDSSAAERTIASSSITVGRFVPDHFAVTAGSVTPRTDIAACSGSAFTYMDEPFGITFKLTAQNASNATTVNYAGTLATLDVSNASYLNFGAIDTTNPAAPTPLVVPISAITKANPGQVTTSIAHNLSTGSKVYLSGVSGMTSVNNALYTVTVVDTTHFTIGTDTSSYGAYTSGGHASRLSVSSASGTWSAGVVDATATLVLQRAVAPDGAFNTTTIGIALQDADGVQASSFDLDADNSGTKERVSIGLTKFRFGRIALKNAHGSELLNLPISMLTQYWNGTAFVTNTDDNCTSISAASNVTMSNRNGGITSTNMASPGNVKLKGDLSAGSGDPVTAGVGKFTLTKPLPTPTAKGSVDLTLDLTTEAKTYLQGKWSGTSYNQNPTSRAAFGIYKGAPFIYQREVH